MSPKPGTKVLGYARVSTDDQAREGVSLDVQERRLRDYCRAREWELVGVVRDEGKSAKDTKRLGLQQILHALPTKRRGWDGLVVVKLDRLTRSVRDLANLMEAFTRAKVSFTSIQESVDTSSAGGELFLNIIGALSQWERKAIGERTRAAMDLLRERKEQRIGAVPYGFTIDASRERQVRPSGRIEAAALAPHPAEQAVLLEIRRLHAAGLSLRQLATRLASKGMMARCGRPFAPQTLKQLVSQGAPADKGLYTR